MSDPRASSKRSACDRCRTQKLRCLRVEWHPADACLRCVRSGSECITTSTKRPGRPPRNPANNASRQPTIPSPRTSPSTTVTNSSSSEPVPVEMQLDPVDDWFNLGPLDSHYDMSSTYWALSDLSELESHSGPACSTDSTHATAFGVCSPPAASTAVHNATLNTQIIDPTLNPGHLELSPDALDRGHDGSFQLSQPGSTQACGHGIWLSTLYRDLSKQLFTLRSESWDIADVVQLTCGYDGFPVTRDLHSPAHEPSNPLAIVTKRSADFANLLQSLQPTGTDTSPSSPHHTTIAMSISPPPTPTHPRLTIADLLTTLSCHMLLLSIYDTILSHFLDHQHKTHHQSKPRSQSLDHTPIGIVHNNAGITNRPGTAPAISTSTHPIQSTAHPGTTATTTANSGTSTPAPATAPAPRLFLGGVPIPTPCQWQWWPSALVGHLLVCLIEAQIRPVEVLLGLPEEFCVAAQQNVGGVISGRGGGVGVGVGRRASTATCGMEGGGKGKLGKRAREGDGSGGDRIAGGVGGGGGLFNGGSGRSLFAALMQVETERMAGAGEDGGLGVVESLREKMRRVQGVGR